MTVRLRGRGRLEQVQAVQTAKVRRACWFGSNLGWVLILRCSCTFLVLTEVGFALTTMKEECDFFKIERKLMLDQKNKQDQEDELYKRSSDRYARRLCEGMRVCVSPCPVFARKNVQDSTVNVPESERAATQVRNAQDEIEMFQKHLDALAEQASALTTLTVDAERLQLMSVALKQVFEWVFQSKKTGHLVFHHGMHQWLAQLCTQLELATLSRPDLVGFAVGNKPRHIKSPAPEKKANATASASSTKSPSPAAPLSSAAKPAVATNASSAKQPLATGSLAARSVSAPSKAAGGGGGSGMKQKGGERKSLNPATSNKRKREDGNGSSKGILV